MTYRLSPENIKNMSADEINKVLANDFSYDHFRSQKDKGVIVGESFRADGLNRPLYKCPFCNTEGKMVGAGTIIKCNACGVETELNEDGTLCTREKDTPFSYVTDWYKWERECVAKEIEEGKYEMELDVDILMLADMKSMYRVGEGHLSHSGNGFVLTGCDGRLNYVQKPKASYGLYSDYYWYEIGDMISIGDSEYQYYCFPKDQKGAIVAKARLATEELYKKATKRN